MSKELEDWLQNTGATVPETSEPSQTLFKRLRDVAEMVADAGPLTSEPQLLYRTTGKKVKSVRIEQELVVGREKPATLVFKADLHLSRQHFRIYKEPEGECLEDLHSRNGTFVNASRTEWHNLRNGDIIEAGHQTFVFFRGEVVF